MDSAWDNPGIDSWDKFEKWLKAGGVDIEYKCRRGTTVREGISFIYKGRKFSGSKIDRRFSYGNLDRRFSDMQRANRKVETPPISRKVQQHAVTIATPAVNSSSVEEQGWSCGGDGMTWPEFRAMHPDLPVKEALRRFRAKKRGANINGGFSL